MTKRWKNYVMMNTFFGSSDQVITLESRKEGGRFMRRGFIGGAGPVSCKFVVRKM